MVLMLAFTRLSELSMEDDELERPRLEVWLVLTLALTRLSTLSTLEEEFDSERLDV